ncbi:MAG: hypothetical protein R3323_09970 [Wenzhouxiangellaceae bacterium]|nr:hypothetical protein [Wenzhouxiangellaceae bacterium]
MASDLVWLVAVGNRRFHHAARSAVEALRGPGGFEGDIALLTDRDHEVPGVSHPIRLSPEDIPEQPKRLKMAVGTFLDLSRWRRVAFLDADVACRGPLMPHVADVVDAGGLAVTDDIGQTVEEGLCSRLLDAEELRVHGGVSLGVNSGFFAGPGEAMPGWLDTWQGIVERGRDRPGRGVDQPALNAAMLRGTLPVCIVPGLMWFPRFDPDRRRCRADAPLAHFHGAGRKWRRAWKMRRFVRRAGRG